MNREEIFLKAAESREKALDVLEKSGIIGVWERSGCRVNVVGSLRMGLLASHRDIDLHVYSSGITTECSFAIMSKIASDSSVVEIKCINGLDTDERCIAWHVMYRAEDSELWQIDIIHIEEGSQYDGYFERMADRIVEVMTPEQKAKILELKFSTSADSGWHGVEFYEAVIADGISSLEALDEWISNHRQKPSYYWIP